MSPWIVGFERDRLCCGSSAIVRRCGVVAPCCLYDVYDAGKQLLLVCVFFSEQSVHSGSCGHLFDRVGPVD